MKKIYLFKMFLMAFVLMLLGGVNASAVTVTSTFTDKNWSVGTGEPTWTKTGASTQDFESTNSARGVQIMLTNIKTNGLSLTNTTIKSLGNIKSVSLVVSSNGTGGSIKSVKVGGTNLKNGTSDSYTVAGKNKNATFTTTENVKGDIKITFASTATKNSLWVKSISVTYEDPTKNSLTLTNGTATYVKAPVSVELIASVAGSTIYYSTDGNKPTKDEEHKYSSPINITKSGTVLKVLATAEGYDDAEDEAEYTIKPAQPVFSEDSKTFKKPLNVTLSLPATTDNTSKIYYAIGKNATAESTLYDGSPITIDAPNDGDKVILHAVVVDEYGNVGTEKRCTYTKTTAVIFDFTANPNVWEIEPTSNNENSNTDGKELPVDGVVLTTTSGSGSKTCIYSGSPITLRVYTGGTLKFTAPAGYELSKIVFDGSISGTFDSGSFRNKIWTATKSVNSVVFSRTGTTEIKTATISFAPATVENKTLVATDSDGAYYATFSSDRDVVFTEDVKVYAVNVTDGKLKLTELTKGDYNTANSTKANVSSGYYVPANTGVLIKATNANITYYTAATGQKHANIPANNQLVAATTNGMFTSDSDHKYYKLAYDDYVNKTGLGFYYGADGGAAFEVKKGLAYLAVPVSVSGSNLAAGYAFGGNGGDDTTGINGIENDNVNETQTIYNLQGQRVEKAGLRGIYIVNGKKVVLK